MTSTRGGRAVWTSTRGGGGGQNQQGVKSHWTKIKQVILLKAYSNLHSVLCRIIVVKQTTSHSTISDSDFSRAARRPTNFSRAARRPKKE